MDNGENAYKLLKLLHLLAEMRAVRVISAFF
jgi:hypothetical protein